MLHCWRARSGIERNPMTIYCGAMRWSYFFETHSSRKDGKEVMISNAMERLHT